MTDLALSLLQTAEPFYLKAESVTSDNTLSSCGESITRVKRDDVGLWECFAHSEKLKERLRRACQEISNILEKEGECTHPQDFRVGTDFLQTISESIECRPETICGLFLLSKIPGYEWPIIQKTIEPFLANNERFEFRIFLDFNHNIIGHYAKVSGSQVAGNISLVGQRLRTSDAFRRIAIELGYNEIDRDAFVKEQADRLQKAVNSFSEKSGRYSFFQNRTSASMIDLLFAEDLNFYFMELQSAPDSILHLSDVLERQCLD